LIQHWNVWSSTLLTLLSLSVLTWGVWGTLSAKRQLKWSKVTAIILSSNVRFDGEVYQPEIEYEFQYQGIRRTGSRVRSNYVASNFKSGARSVCDRYPVGEEVTVYVDPENPAKSVLEPGGDRWHLPLAIAIAAFFMLVALLFRWD
jgi:hypothetical protein